MAVVYNSFNDWADAFAKAAWLLLAGREEGGDGLSAEVEACEVHGAECACVNYGGLIEHFRWADHDPGALAEELLYPVCSQPDECER